MLNSKNHETYLHVGLTKAKVSSNYQLMAEASAPMIRAPQPTFGPLVRWLKPLRSPTLTSTAPPVYQQFDVFSSCLLIFLLSSASGHKPAN